MTNADLRYKVEITKLTKQLKFTDTSNYGGATTIKGLVRIVNPLGVDVYKNTGYDAGDYTNPDIDLNVGTDNFSMTLLEDSNGDIVEGEYEVFYRVEDSSIPQNYTSNKKFTYCYTSPTVSINYTILCDTSTLTSEDITDYNTINNKVTLTDYVITRTHSVSAPEGSGYGSIADTTDTKRTFSDIWTKIWQTSISTNVVYNIEYWDSAVWYSIADTVTGSNSANVMCSSCTCNLRQCVINLYNKWIASLNVRVANDLKDDVLKVTALYTQYLQAERCGVSTQEYCNSIATILNSNDCECAIEDNTSSTEVVPIKDNSIGSYIYVLSDAPASDLGVEKDMYINTTTSDLYTKDANGWVLKGNIKGIKGDKGDKGDAGDNSTPENFFTHQVSFEAHEIGSADLYIPIDCGLENIYAYVSKDIDATYKGVIDFKVGATLLGTINAPAGSVYGTTLTPVTAIGYIFHAGDKLSISTSTANEGRVYLVIHYIKL